MEKERQGCLISPKNYEVNLIKKLSGNRFMIISNYGIKIYSLNKKNQYTLVLMDEHLEGLEKIYEVKENQFIFCTNKHISASLGGPEHDNLLIERIDINNIQKKDMKEKIEELKGEKEKEKKFKFEFFDKISIRESKSLISSLLFIHSGKIIFEYCMYDELHEFSDFIILKKQYFIILMSNNLLIINLINFELIKRYTFLVYGEKNLYKDKFFKIKKWDNENDNEFLIFKEGNIILFELNENNLNEKVEISLDIIGFIYSSYLNDFSLDKINGENRFIIKKKISDEDDEDDDEWC